MKKLFISCLVFMVLVLNFKLIDIKVKDFTTTTSGVISFTNAVLVTSTNNNLASLSVNNRSVPNFNAKTLSYDLGRTDSSSINIAAVTADGKATVSGTGTRNLAYGKNTLGVVVTAESGAKKTYNVVISRNDYRSSNSYLGSLGLSVGELTFNKTTQAYTVVVDNAVTRITIAATPEDNKANVSGDGTKTLKVYTNTFNIVVTAENQTRRTYTLNIVRRDIQGNAGNLSINNKLKSLEIVGYPITFSSDVKEYEVMVDNTVEFVEIKAETDDRKAALTINNIQELQFGVNDIHVIVTSESGDSNTYLIRIIRSTLGPVMPLEKVLEAITDTVTEELVAVVGPEDEIDKEIFDALMTTKKKLIVQRRNEVGELMYSWSFDGNQMVTTQMVKSGVIFGAMDILNIDIITNFARRVDLSFLHSGELPKGTIFTVYVGDDFDDNEVLKFYYYNKETQQMELVNSNIIVVDGYVSFPLERCSDYILTKAVFTYGEEEQELSPWIFVSGGLALMILLLASMLFQERKRNPYRG
ncbi:MAG: cadherin-like beta sandwich domain-containing protein [Erysipelotrichaceae bacterium]|nr:cadherin-like beta sandwich domain-containing protein [Erysipelotrichaceae bacterium]